MKVVQTSAAPTAIGPYSQGIIVGKYEVLKVAFYYRGNRTGVIA